MTLIMKSFFTVSILLMATGLFAQDTYWQQKVDYRMNVALDPNDNSLQAFARITYTNRSPDTLPFIWFHLWPNAYRNDRTAFSDQLLENDRTDFYFADNDQRGYINRLDFRIEGKPVQTQDHPEHIDIIKLILPSPLPPGASVEISTPFHVSLPYNFSRGGYSGKTYQVTQWYPKPAVYDRKGWHPMPYLDQGEFYAEFGDYEVDITVPGNFVVAATGAPQFKVEDALFIPKRQPVKRSRPGTKKPATPPFNWDGVPRITYSYRQKNVIDFAWFADTTFTVQQDTYTLPSGRQIRLRCYFHLSEIDVWANAVHFMKDALRYHSEWIGDYPYDDLTVVDGAQGVPGGMEYPTITILNGAASPKELDLLIFHETGHNWFQAAVATNERKHPWMDEGMNTYYDNRYEQLKYPPPPAKGLLAVLRDPRYQELMIRTQVGFKKDQPMTTPADSFTAGNYSMIAYDKTALWMKRMDETMGRSAFDEAMRQYYQTWKFRHPQPEDFEAMLRRPGTDSLFSMLGQKGNIYPEPRREVKVTPLYRLRETYDSRPVYIMPIINYNSFNGFMPGIALHNYSLPLPRFNFIAAPMVGIKSGKLNGWGRVAYTWYPSGMFSRIEASSIFSSFNQRIFRDSTNKPFSLAYRKVAPGVKLTFRNTYERSTVDKFLQFRLFLIGEDDIRLVQDLDSNTQVPQKTTARYDIFQARFVYIDNRKLYPYKGEVLWEANREFMRFNVIGNYFFNFRKKGGVNLRLYAGKFIYLSPKDVNTAFDLQRFHLNMTGPNGQEDYTYGAPFIGRNEFSGLWSQQIMARDGYFKVRTDLLSQKVGRSDDWLTAVNLEMDVPDRFNPFSMLPVKVPLKLFADIGASGATWREGSGGSRLLYDGGLQVSFLNNILNFYFPLVYSGVYRDYFKSTPGNGFFQRMSFSINIQDLTFKQVRQSFVK